MWDQVDKKLLEHFYRRRLARMVQAAELFPVFFSSTEEKNDFFDGRPSFRVILFKFNLRDEDPFDF